jgi:drug/metabolite transporter (DMT)-like permease
MENIPKYLNNYISDRKSSAAYLVQTQDTNVKSNKSGSFKVRRKLSKASLASEEVYRKSYSTLENLTGAMLMSLSAFLFAILFLIQKHFFTMYPQISFAEQNVIRGVSILLINGSFVIIRKEDFCLSGREKNILLSKRVLCDFFAELFIFLSTDYLRISTTSIFYVSYVVICCLISGVMLNEVVERKDVIISLSSLFAACLIIKPFYGQGNDTFTGICLGLSTSVLLSMMVIYHKLLNAKISNFSINFWMGCSYFIVGVISHLTYGDRSINLDTYSVLYLFLFGAIITTSNLLFNYALNCSKVSYTLPFENSNVVFSLVLGIFVLGEPYDRLDILGTLLILSLYVYRSLLDTDEEEASQDNQSFTDNDDEKTKALIERN